MIIPSSIKVGGVRYTVIQMPNWAPAPPFWRGSTTYALKTIHIGYGSRLGYYTQKQKAETFWHELTHTILHDMDSPLNRNETFVTEFSRRLNNAIHSAKFD